MNWKGYGTVRYIRRQEWMLTEELGACRVWHCVAHTDVCYYLVALSRSCARLHLEQAEIKPQLLAAVFGMTYGIK